MAPDQATADMVTELKHMRIGDDPPVKIHHDTPEADRAEAGFDLTTFAGVSAFRSVLQAFDLDPATSADAVYAKVDKNPGDPDYNYGAFVWANEDVALITGNNPITGEYSDPTMREPEKGYASYIGISGDPDLVDELFDTIEDEARHIKGRDPDDRQFI